MITTNMNQQASCLYAKLVRGSQKEAFHMLMLNFCFRSSKLARRITEEYSGVSSMTVDREEEEEAVTLVGEDMIWFTERVGGALNNCGQSCNPNLIHI